MLVAGLVRFDVRARPRAQHVQADAALLAAQDLHVPRLPRVRLCARQGDPESDQCWTIRLLPLLSMKDRLLCSSETSCAGAGMREQHFR